MSEDGREADVVVQQIGPWTVEMRWLAGGVQGGPCELIVRPTNPDEPPPGGVSSTVLRQIDVKAAADSLRQRRDAEARRKGAKAEHDAQRGERMRKTLEHEGISDSYLAQLSSAYVSAANRGQKAVVAHLADIVGKGESTVKGHLLQARTRGLLTPSAGTRTGGQLTEKASEILKEVVPGAADLKALGEM